MQQPKPDRGLRQNFEPLIEKHPRTRKVNSPEVEEADGIGWKVACMVEEDRRLDECDRVTFSKDERISSQLSRAVEDMVTKKRFRVAS